MRFKRSLNQKGPKFQPESHHRFVEKNFITSRKQEVDDQYRRAIRAYTPVCAGVGTITRYICAYIAVTLSEGLSLSLYLSSRHYIKPSAVGMERRVRRIGGCEKGRISHNVRVTHSAHHAPLAPLPREHPPRGIETSKRPQKTYRP